MSEQEIGVASSTSEITTPTVGIRSDDALRNSLQPETATLPRGRQWKSRVGIIGSGLAILAIVLCARAYWGANRADAEGTSAKKQTKKSAADARTKSSKTTVQDDGVQPASANAEENSQAQVVAAVNGQEIRRSELASQALRVFGDEDLQNIVNRQILVQSCKAQGVTVTRSDVDAEIDRMARRFGLSTDRFFAMLKEERGVTASQYAKDIIWPMLALRKLAKDAEVSSEELREIFEAKYGPAVKVRLIACNDQKKAKRVQAEARSQPDKFAALAKRESDDPSASVGGVVQPIHKHFGNDQIERAAFQLEVGQVSEVIPIAPSAPPKDGEQLDKSQSMPRQYIILKCEQRMPPAKVSMEQVAKELEAEVREGKERQASNEIFRVMQEKSKIEVYYNTEKARQFPGVAASVNDRKITLRELGEASIERHGTGVLEGMITRRLLEQACKEHNVTVTQQDLDAEVERAAAAVGTASPEGKPLSVKEWLDTVTQQQGVTVETYLHDAVWPTVALKKLVSADVKVGDDDLRKGFEANFGPRVRCLAIVLSNQRKAQEVWQMARENNTPEQFGQLAEQYSVEESSRLLRGEVPPIQKHGGQPILEEGAFSLQPGELSSVLQVGDKFVILRCEGRTEPVKVKFAEVKQTIYDDIYEKKLRMAMTERLDNLKDAAHIENFLAGTFHTPVEAKGKNVKGSPSVAGKSSSLNGGPQTAPREAAKKSPAKSR